MEKSVNTLNRLRYFLTNKIFLLQVMYRYVRTIFVVNCVTITLFFIAYAGLWWKSMIFIVLSSLETLHDTVQYRYRIFSMLYHLFSGPGTVVSTVTGYGLDGPGIESQLGERFSAPVQTGPGAHPASCTMGTGSFPGIKSSWGVTTLHPLLVPWSWKGRATPLLPLWAVRPVQSLSACTRVTFIFFFLIISWVRKYTVNVQCSI